ncbi:MAG TPA: transposase [Candidatus Acidoferrales bacterium]|nr:transposase [Candidatus Acidoferrales bacterium]
MELLARIRNQRDILDKGRRAGTTIKADEVALHEMQVLIKKAERCLDEGRGTCYMRDRRIAQIVENAITSFEGNRYRLFAWCVMPNHVHAVFSPLGQHRLKDILHTWKSFSAHEAKRILGGTGAFWQREYFDHLIRNQSSFQKIISYVKENPSKARLDNWPWLRVLSREWPQETRIL